MPAYEHRRQNRNYTTTYRMWGEKFETVPFHELRTEEAGHHWTPTAQEVHEMWEARLEDPTAPWYVSPAPERFPPLKTETPREPMPYEIMSVRSVPKYGRNAYERSEYRRRAKNNDFRKLRHVSPAGENRNPPNPTSNDQQPPSTSATHATPSPTAATSPSNKGAAPKSKGLSAQVSSPPVSKKKLTLATPGQATPVGEFKTNVDIEQWRDTVNKELKLESAPSTSSDEYRAYGDERIDYRLYNEMEYTDPENSQINHDMEEDIYQPFGFWDSRKDERDIDDRLVPASDVSDALAVALANGDKVHKIRK